MSYLYGGFLTGHHNLSSPIDNTYDKKWFFNYGRMGLWNKKLVMILDIPFFKFRNVIVKTILDNYIDYWTYE